MIAVAELAEADRLGEDEMFEGERRLCYDLAETDGRLTISKGYRAVAAAEVGHEPFDLPSDMVARIRARPRTEERYLLSIFTPPGSIKGNAYWVALLMDDHQQILMTDIGQDFAAAARLVFQVLAGQNKTGQRNVPVPAQIWTDSRPILDALAPAMAEVGVLLFAAEEVPELDVARESMADFMARGGR